MRKTTPKETKHYDYIIVGSGITGLLSAINASKKGSILLLSKEKLLNSNTYHAQGGISAVVSNDDSFKKHIKDTLESGHDHNNRKTVEFIVKKAPAAIKKLSQLGVNFTKTSSGTYELKLEGGHSSKRIVQSKDSTGKTIVEALIKQIKNNKKIDLIENCFVKDLLVRVKTCYGVQVIYKSKFHNYYGINTILATGGIGQIFEKTTNPKVATADGIAMAKRAGAKTKDLEFVQFHPSALNRGQSPLFLLSETLRGSGATLVNKKLEQFMSKYDDKGDLAPRDIVAQAIYQEQKKGKVYLDMRSIKTSTFKKQFPHIYNKLLSYKIDPSASPAPITPAAHYSCGGIQTDLKNSTSIKNLYAIGEVACNGLHGANRLASNSLLEGAVMSEIIPPLPKKHLKGEKTKKYLKGKKTYPENHVGKTRNHPHNQGNGNRTKIADKP